MYNSTLDFRPKTTEELKDVALSLLRLLFPNGHPDFIPLCLEIMELYIRKNQGYTGGQGESNPLGNFYRRAERMEAYPERAIPVWEVPLNDMDKQLDAARIQSINQFVDDKEPFDTRMMDCALYSLIAILLYREEK